MSGLVPDRDSGAHPMFVPDRVVIGLDVGTTGVKAAAFGLGTPWCRSAMREYPLLEPVTGEHVQDPAAVIDAATDALASCVAQVERTEVVGISVSCGMHGLLALDSDQRPLTPLLTWADARATGEARELHRAGAAAALHRSTGVPVHPMSPLTKLRWFADHEPALYAAARWWVGLKELVLLWLTGQVVTELSSASGSGLLDMASRTWSASALETSGVDPDRLPEIRPTTSTLPLLPSTARTVGLPAGLPVVLGAGDGPLANVGAGAIDPGVAGLSVGTSGAVRVVADRPRVDARGALFCYALTDDLWVLGGALGNGGSAVRWVARSLVPDLADGASDGTLDDAVLDLAATVPPGCDGLVMLPYLLPERAPLWDAEIPGAYLGLANHHTRAHLARAAVEGVCQQLRLVLDALDRAEPVTSVQATGGAFRSALWRDVLAATLARPLVVVGSERGTALGAAALGLVALGVAPTLRDGLAELTDPAAPPPIPVPMDPDSVSVYDRLRASVPDLVSRLGPTAAAFGGSGPRPPH